MGLEQFSEFVSPIINKGKKRDLLRIGIVGFGNRAKDLAKRLGFLHPDEMSIDWFPWLGESPYEPFNDTLLLGNSFCLPKYKL